MLHIKRGAPKEQRFFKYVKVVDSCWVWQGGVDAKGYGHFQAENRRCVRAHRFSWELVNGPIPKGMQLDHLCRDTACVNPLHLEVVSNLTNTLRSTNFIAVHAQKTHCVNGHPFDGINSYIGKRRNRVCRQCQRDRMERFKAKS